MNNLPQYYREGMIFNVVSNDIKNKERAEDLDAKIKNRIKRFEIQAQYQDMNHTRILIQEEENKDKLKNKVSQDRFKQEQQRGYDIVTQLDSSLSPNREAKHCYYQQIEKSKPWDVISQNTKI